MKQTAKRAALTPGEFVKLRGPEQLRKYLLRKQQEQEAQKRCPGLKN